VRILAHLVRRRAEAGWNVVLVGDFNAEPGFRLLAPLRDLGLEQQTREPTHGHRVIDLAWTRGVRVIEGRVLALSSDHRAAVITVEPDDREGGEAGPPT
jgi:endonuclease/exonuclease/phosphatase (EEP) superfamily protein YafD